jgi:3-phytase
MPMTRKNRARCAFGLTLMAGVAAVALGAQAQTAAPALPAVTPMAETAPTVRNDANTGVLVFDAAGGMRIAGSGGLGGVELYDAGGARLASVPAGEVVGLDVRYGVSLNGRSETVLGVMDAQQAKLRFFAVGDTLTEVTAGTLSADLSAEAGCLYKSPLDGGLFMFALGAGGEIEQWSIFDNGQGRLDGRLVRRLHIASEASYCTVDDLSGALYVAEQAVGVWKFDAEPEAESIPTLIDAVGLGRIAEEAGGVAVVDGGPGARYLITSNASANDFHVFNREDGHRYLGSFTTAGVENAGGLAAGGGLFLAMDDDNPAGANYKLARLSDIAAALKLGAGSPADPRAPLPAPLPIVRPIAETVPVGQGGDAADDPAIWVNRVDPARSLIIGTDKQAGLGVYNLAGKRVSFAADGKMNNVDLRDGFKLAGQAVTLVSASDRTKNAIALYVLDGATGTLRNVSDSVQGTGLGDPYGLCMYRGKGGKTYVFINDTDGKMRQWRLEATTTGTVKAVLVREFAFATQTEGCVADDETGWLYVAEEDVALWRLNAEPKGPEKRTQVTSVASNPALKDDLEGVSLYLQPGGKGYIVVSSQGNNSYAVFARDGDNPYIGSFAVVANGPAGIDGSSETDGLDVTSRPMGPLFPNGALVTQDGRNVSPPQPQNFKITPWTGIEAALKLAPASPP